MKWQTSPRTLKTKIKSNFSSVSLCIGSSEKHLHIRIFSHTVTNLASSILHLFLKWINKKKNYCNILVFKALVHSSLPLKGKLVTIAVSWFWTGQD